MSNPFDDPNGSFLGKRSTAPQLTGYKGHLGALRSSRRIRPTCLLLPKAWFFYFFKTIQY